MCLIIHCPKGTDKKAEFIKEAIKKASEFNQDGMGYAIKRRDGSLYLNKGYIDVDTFIKSFESQKVRKDEEIVFHLRIGNKGATNIQMCHPFVVSNDDEEVLNVHDGVTDKPLVAHNGTMLRHAITNSDKSDTFYFIKNVLSKQSVLNFLKEDAQTFVNVMQPHLAASRLAVLFPGNQNTILIGKWHTLNGLNFSKDYYEEYFPKPVSTINYYRGRDYYDDFDWDNYNKNLEDWDDTKSNTNTTSDFRIVNIPNIGYQRPFFEDSWGYKHTNYMGLYLPEKESLINYTVELNYTNFDAAQLTVIDQDYQYGIFNKFEYEVESIDLYNINVKSLDSDYEITIPKNIFYEKFKVRFLGSLYEYYNAYYRLVRDLPVSKSLCNKLIKVTNSVIERDLDLVTFKHDGKRYNDLDLDLVLEFINNMEEELRLRKHPHRLLF